MKDGYYWATFKDKYCPVLCKKGTLEKSSDEIMLRLYRIGNCDKSFEYVYFADFHEGLYKRDCFSLTEFLIEFDILCEVPLPPAGSP